MKSVQTKAGILIAGTVILSTVALYAYQSVFTANFRLEKPEKILYIRTGMNFTQLIDTLVAKDYVVDPVSFGFMAKIVGYQEAIKPGAYLIPKNANNKDVLIMLKRGTQQPVKFTFNNLRLKEDLAQLMDKKFEPTEADYLSWMNNLDSTKSVGFDTLSIISMFIPNTYEVRWNTNTGALMRRMKKEYDKFWTEDRLKKAEVLKLSPLQVSTLASIVQSETVKQDEMPRVAGVYYNRLMQDMRLQADPTVVFAVRDFNIKRVLTRHLSYDSPYNTYRNKGLPPGPIRIPDIQAIDAVLNMEKHEYMYFCAKEDFSGYHNFAKDYASHLIFARKYQQALNAAGIK